MADEKTIEEPKKTQRELKKETRERNEHLRAEKAAKKKLQYQAIKDEAAFVDLRKTIKDFSDYHTKIAKDATGYKDDVDREGRLIQTLVTLTNEERLAHLDKAAGQDEILDMIDRQLA